MTTVRGRRPSSTQCNVAHIVAASALQAKDFATLRSALPGYITEGLTFLVSRPKLGKSWLMLDVSVGIATGRTTLGTLQPEIGDVLYLALDDGERRLQLRLAALLKGEKTWPARLALATRWRRANDGGLSDIEEWCQFVANPVAVVIDSLDRFRSLQGGESAQVYDAIEKLQRIARDHRIAIVVVHHERRRGSGDPLDTIGMLAASSAIADTVLLLKRRDHGVVLYARGRDIEDSETMLEFDRSSHRWNIVEPTGVVTKSEARAAVLAALASSVKPLSAVEIANATGRSRSAIDTLLHRMIADEEVRRLGRGRYALSANTSQRTVHEFRWADGSVIARFRGNIGKNERLDDQDTGAETKSPVSSILQKPADV
jgi:hypothetical protein